MPHINSIRLTNVHFNNATQLYDDFRMELGGKNTTYDLENGGGKSLLLQLILQTVLPKSYLRKEKPVSLIFQGVKDKTSHVAVEWILEEGSGYKYLLTGFCVRKRRGSGETAGIEEIEEEENYQASDIEHLNWCVFYNDHKITGIKSVPFVTEETGKKIYAGFEDIRKYIQQMRQKGLPAEIFDRIDQYQSYISAHNLIATEWNIIKGINSGENNIESYFRQNITSRKLIENQFVKIIEDVEALNKGEKNNNESLLLADTLIEIRSSLNEYLKLKGHMAEFEKIKEYYSEFQRKNEELYKTFQEYEAYKQQAVAIRNLILKRLKALEKEKIEAEDRLEDNLAGSQEGISLKRLLEAGLVNHQKEGLSNKRDLLEEEYNRFAEKQRDREENLNRLLILEGYGEYRGAKDKKNAIQKRLQSLKADEDSINADYRAAGGKLRFLESRLYDDLLLKEKKSQDEKNELVNSKEKNKQERIKEERKESALNTEAERLSIEERNLVDRQKVLHNFFLEQGEMNGVLSPEMFLKELKEDLNRFLSEEESLLEKIETLNKQFKDLELDTVRNQGEIDRLSDKEKQYRDWLEAYQQELSLLEKKAATFEKGTLWEYQEGLELLIQKESLSKLEKEIEGSRMRQKRQLSMDRGYYVPNDEVLALVEQLNQKCEHVQAGIDWIAMLDTAEKEKLLHYRPYLPFSIIVDEISFEKLKRGRIKLNFSSDYPVPIVNLETVRVAEKLNQQGIYYFCSFTDLLLDKSQYEEYLASMETTLININKEVSEGETRITELTAQLSGLNVFFGKYPKEQVESNEISFQELKNEMAALEQHFLDRQEEKNRIRKELNLLYKKEKELTEQKEECNIQIEKLIESIKISDELNAVREQSRVKNAERTAVRQNIAVIKKCEDSLDRRYASLEDQIIKVRLNLQDVGNRKENLTGFEEIENNQPIDRLRTDYEALYEMVRGSINQEQELRKEFEENEKGLNGLKTRISREYGGDLEDIEKKEKEGVLITIPSQTVINNTKAEIKEGNEQIKTWNEKIVKISLEIQKIEGKLEEILKGFPEDVKNDLPIYDNEYQYMQEIDSAEQLIASYKEGIKKAEEELEAIKEELSKLNNQMEDYEAFMEREKVINNESVAQEIKEYRPFEREYQSLKSIIEELCNDWEKRIAMIYIESSDFVIREPLDELSKISTPYSKAQCLSRRDAFIEYIANIEEQMRKISNDILQLEKYQEDFVQRCVQRAELVLGHLRKLESLSRIQVYGRRTNMIELRLQEFEKKEKSLRMKAHIESIVKEISMEGSVDRKRIALLLATKELLAQIVDMNKAVVRLYKVESIPENSRFYRWETAVGSEGQNNSLYFIFAACLISFIRMLSITNSSVKTKKVIIADNPFGSTSAVYLWEPMFQIMKQNDIQLIAPGHRIPREITSKFSVSYLLNQDILNDGRMRVVVKDVRAEEDEDVLRYIDPEQLTLF
ncbi:MAG: hypothetical protein PHR60_04185 [Eubacteriales bacterium]|nr:hypothetical protein [Eubacteriales bacterium]MDD4583370.1 hypothetical protein [Eubacteriales bacterium]